MGSGATRLGPLVLLGALYVCDARGAEKPVVQVESFEMGPGVVVAPGDARLYVMNSDGGIEGIDARSGESRWTTRSASRPLLVHGGKLLAQQMAAPPGHVVRLVFLSLAHEVKEGLVVSTLALPLPADVVPALDETADHTFRLRARPENGSVLVSWEHTKRYVNGQAPAKVDVPPVKNAVGCARISGEGANAGLVLLQTCPSVTPAEIPESVRGPARAGAFATAPQRLGDLIFATVVTESAPSTVALSRWDAKTGAALAPTPLGDGQPVAQLASPDGRHLLVSMHAQGADHSERVYRWAVVDTETGALVADLRRPGSAAPFCVLGPRLLTIEQPSGRRIDGKWTSRPLHLVALDLQSGREVWSRPLRDTAYRGEMPPRP